MRHFIDLVPYTLLGLLGVALCWFLGSANPSTPAGYVGYVTQGSVFGHRQFLGTQAGPTSSGRKWLADVVNVSVTPYTYDEAFAGDEAILSKDSLKISFAIHLVWRIDPQQARNFVEHFSTLSTEKSSDAIVRTAYENFMRQPLRTFARDELQKFDGLEIKNNIGLIGSVIETRLKTFAAGSPFEVNSVVVGNIQYPPEVSQAVSEKLASTQILERKKIEVTIADAEAKRRVVEAQGIADSMNIINQKLTSQYLQHEAIEAQKQMVNSPNHTVIYIPTGQMGVPLTATMDAEGKDLHTSTTE
jgi:regulator of protease activity HflC (stomatin/prohibitin superfamily)